MAMRFGDNIDIRVRRPLDMRESYDDTASMKSASDKYSRVGLYDGLVTWLKEEQRLYIFNSANEEDSVYGRWRPYSDIMPSITRKELEDLVQ